MKSKILPFILFTLAISSAFAQQVNITFEVSTATIPSIDPEGLYIAGGSGFGSPGDNPLTDDDGDGVYSVTVQRDQGFSSYYIYLNGNCPDYSCKENIAGLPCSDPANFNDRFLPPVMSDTTILACFGTCESDGNCTVVTDSIEITFQLNTSNITVDGGGIFIAGGGNFGVPGDNPMIDPDGDGIYTFTTTRPVGFTSFYTFTNGNCGDFSCKENLEGLPCGDPNSFNDRFISSVMQDMTVFACFGNCADDGSCMETSTNELVIDKNLFTLRPTLANDYAMITFGENAINQEKEINLINAVGEVLNTTALQSQDFYRIDTTPYANGIYFLMVKTGNKMLTKKFIVQK